MRGRRVGSEECPRVEERKRDGETRSEDRETEIATRKGGGREGGGGECNKERSLGTGKLRAKKIHKKDTETSLAVGGREIAKERGRVEKQRRGMESMKEAQRESRRWTLIRRKKCRDGK